MGHGGGRQHSLLRRRTCAWLVIVGLAGAAGCAKGGGEPLSSWTLRAPHVQTQPVELPAHLDDVLPDRSLRYHLSTTLELTPAQVGRDLELVWTYMPAPVVLRVDGRRVEVQPGAGIVNPYGGMAPRRWRLPPAGTARGRPIRLELEVTHVWTQSAWLVSVPELVEAGVPLPQAERNRALNEQGAWFGLIALSQVGITFLVVYFWDRRRRAYLYFAVQGLTASYYPAYVLGLPSLWLSWPTQNVLLAQSLAVAPIISVYFTHAFFDLPPPSRLWQALLGVALVSPVTVAVRDVAYHDLSYAAPIVVLCVLSAVLYQIAIGLRLLRGHADRGTVIFFLCCWIALGSSSWVDLLAWLGVDVLEGGRPAGMGLGLFGIFQSLLLGRSHFRTLAEADRLNDDLRLQVRVLEERQQEVASLNEELRRQIGRRSAEILTALTAHAGRGSVEIGPGYVIEARYRVLGVLGSGGMGTVYRAVRVSDDRTFALKVSQDVRGLELARLAKEAQIATRVHHPNVVSIVDADVAEAGFVFLVMELVEGKTLAQCPADRALEWRLEVLRQTLEGVRALHAEGIIHRDLKPGNILVAEVAGERPQVKITDFGISRWLSEGTERAAGEVDPDGSDGALTTSLGPAVPDRESTSNVRTRYAARRALEDSSHAPRLTQTGVISGTPMYIAPELAERDAVLDPAVDVYSFGVVAYQLLTGKPPHLSAPLLARLGGREISPVPPLADQVRGLSVELAHALDACLSPEPHERPGIEALLALLRPSA